MKKLVLAGLLCLVSPAAQAHDWYPTECCSGQDCAPAIRVAATEGGLWVTTIHGTAFFNVNFEKRESKDGRLHACMRPESEGKFKPLCLFVPPST